MALESATYISDLVSTNPTSSDNLSQGDDHLRLLKSTVKATFPNVSGAVLPTHTELNFVDGVTSSIQTQLDAKQPLDASLTSYATLTTAANKGIYYTGADTPATYDLSVYARTLLDDADAATARATLGLGSLSTLSAVGTAQITDANVTTAKIADSNVTTAKIADNAVTGAKIAIGSDAQGDVMYYNGTDWDRLPAGTSGQVLKTNGAGANPSWANETVAGWVKIAENTSLTSGTSWAPTVSLSGYKVIVIQYLNVSTTQTGGSTLQLNGAQIAAATSTPAQAVTGMLWVELLQGYAYAGTRSSVNQANTSIGVTTATTTLSFAWAAGSFDAGSITIYGIA